VILHEIYLSIVVAIIVCLISGTVLIPFLRKLNFKQYVRTDGPRAHLQKSGTPTMGGIMFFLSLTLTIVFVHGINSRLAILLLVTLGFGIIGFFDDFIKVVMKRPLGLKAKEKIFGQVILSGVFAYIAIVYLERGTDVIIPGTSVGIDLGWLYVPFVILVMVGTNNAVNLTDGLDGLATGVTAFTALAYLMITKTWGIIDLSIFSAALLGSCLGFLFFNIHPARVFMGDTGSLALGGAVGSLAVLTKTELLLLIVGGVYVLETLSVILQVSYFKISRGQRLFLMSPLHHHFELLGWSEQRVVFTFWSMAALFAALAVTIMI